MKESKKRLEQLQEKLSRITRTSLNKVKTVTKTYKKALGTCFCAAALLTATSTIQIETVKAEDKKKFETIFHVYIDDDRVGAVDNANLVDNLVNNKVSTYSNNYEKLNLVVGEDIKLIPEIVFRSRANNTATLAELENRLSVKAEATSLEVDGQAVAFVGTEEDFANVIKKLKLEYVSEEQLVAVLKAKEQGLTFSEPAIGENVILDVRLSKEVKMGKVPVAPSSVLSVEDAVKQLKLGTLEEDKYIVQAGDVLGTIAETHKLSVQDLLTLNPTINENSLIRIGDELNVTVYEPIVKVIVEESAKVKEEIPFKTETKDDKNMWRGDTKVQQEGKVGERVVSYSITRENGRTIQRQILSENVTKEPQTKIVLKGSKVSSSRGTGKIAWPAVGGYISSYQGTRWGKFHRGIDIARPSNKSILAADNGTVTSAGWDGSGYGNKVTINHNNGITTLYAHLSSIDVKVGQTVSQGQKIGVMGSTGNSTGVHLHFEILQNGKLKNQCLNVRHGAVRYWLTFRLVQNPSASLPLR